MRIVFFTRLFYPHIGGVEKHVYEVSKRLVAAGHSVVIITEKFQSDLSDHQEFDGMELYRIPVGANEWLKKFAIWRWFWSHNHLLKKADVIHCHDVFFWYLPFRLFFITKKVYTTFHGYEGNAMPTKRAIFMHVLSEKLSFGNICVGEFLRKWYGTKPNSVTYGGVTEQGDKIVFRQIERNRKIHIVFIGRLEEETGIMVYVRALAVAQARGIPIQMVVLGDGSKRADAEKYCKRHNLFVRFKGFVNAPEKYFAACHFVFTSRYLGILEAMAAKRFVFAVYNNSIKEDYLRMTPFSDSISITKDEHSLASDIVFYTQNQQITFEKANNGYLFAKKQTWESMTHLYQRLWT